MDRVEFGMTVPFGALPVQDGTWYEHAADVLARCSPHVRGR
jgi:hypothetical protein